VTSSPTVIVEMMKAHLGGWNPGFWTVFSNLLQARTLDEALKEMDARLDKVVAP